MFESKYYIKITGPYPKSFLSKLIALKIELLKVKTTEDALFLLVEEENYKKIKDLKTIYKIELINCYGIAKVKYLYRKYFLFLVSILFALLLLKFLSSLILKVEVIHTKEEIRNLIITDLEEYGIKPYRFKVSFQKREQIKEKILEKENDHLEWIEIEEKGTTYRINVEERKKNKKEQKKESQSIVAKKRGRILEIEASHGAIEKKKNDYVQKGDVIINGIIKNKDTPVSKVRAEGKVFAEIWYRVKIEVPYNYKEEIKTGKKKKCLEFSFLNHNITLLDLKPYQNKTQKRVKLLRNNILPISFYLTTQEEVKIQNEVKNPKQAYQKAVELAIQKLKNNLGKEDKIISQKTLKKSHKNSKIEVEIFFKVKENITDTISLKDIKLEDLQKEAEKEEE